MAAGNEFGRLWDAVGLVDSAARERPGACEAWSVKDLLAHLDAWHQMVLDWETVGSAGGKPEMPAPGRTWAETPTVNQLIFERTKDDPWVEVVERLRNSHKRVMEVVDSYNSEELFTKMRYPWTGSTSVGSYFVSASSSHYAWASKLIRRWGKDARAR